MVSRQPPCWILAGGGEGEEGEEERAATSDCVVHSELTARKTPHRVRPRTAEPASPLGEGKTWRPWTKRGPRVAVSSAFRPEDPSPVSAEDARTCLSPRRGEDMAPMDQAGPAGGGFVGVSTGRPLTECRRVRRRLPLPLERVKTAAPLGEWISAGLPAWGARPEDPSPISAEDGRICLSPWRGEEWRRPLRRVSMR